MLQNYLKVSFRNLLRHKSFSLINILGLSIGMPVALLAILVVSGQRDLDRFHANSDRIFRIITTVTHKPTGNMDDLATAPAPLARVVAAERPEVERAVRLHGFASAARVGQKVVSLEGFFAEEAFFEVFSFRLTSGDPGTALKEPFSAVVTQRLATTLFGDEDAMGRVLTASFGDIVIRGIMEDHQPDRPTHIQREMLVSFSTLEATKASQPRSSQPDNWDAPSTFYQYLLLADNEMARNVEASFAEMLKKNVQHDSPFEYVCSLQPITGIAFGPELVNQIGRVMEGPVLYIFLIIAVIVMAPVLFNYVSLTIARTLKRSKEVGVRKVVGASRSQIVGQLLVESCTISVIALVPAVIVLDSLLPVFNDFQFVDYISLDWKSDVRVYVLFVSFGLAAGLLAGIVPAVVFSSMKPASALKGLNRIPGFSGMALRRVFLVIQFTLSLVFITMTMVFHRQLEFMVRADYGFDKEHIVGVSLRNVPFSSFKAEVMRTSGVIDVSAASDLIGRSNPDPGPEVMPPNGLAPIKAISFAVSENHVDNLGFRLLAGRNFSALRSTDTSSAIIVNETAVRRFGFSDAASAVGQIVTVASKGEREIIGVTKDFHYMRLQNAIHPVILEYDPDRYAFALIRVAPNTMAGVLPSIEAAWADLSGEMSPMRYRFLDDYILGAYNDMREITVFLKILAGLAIAISCLGLLGIAIFNTETRTKEIGVRKVFGASSASIVVLLSRDLMSLLAFAVLFATPILWAFVNFMFFERVAFRIELDLLLFLSAFGVVLLSALLTIGSQTVRTAERNPVDSLRYE